MIYDKQKNKIVLNEPSVIVKDRKTGELIAVGKKAKEMQGKTAVTSVVIRPLREGVISDIDATREMLSAFIKTNIWRFTFQAGIDDMCSS